MGSTNGGKATAVAHTLIETTTLKCITPQVLLAKVLNRIPDDKINCIDELLSWK